MKKIAGGSGAQKTFMLSFHCKAVELDTDAFIGEMKESHWPRFDVIWVQSSSFMSSCTWCGVFSLTLVFSSETSCRTDGDSEVHPEGGTRTTTTVSSLNQGGTQDVSRSSRSFSSANTSVFRAQSGSDPCTTQDPQS